MEAIKGYVVLTQTISGMELVWNVDEHPERMPQVFKTVRDTQLEILDDLMTDIGQFRDGEREWDEIYWPENEYYIAQIEISENGDMVVFEEQQLGSGVNIRGTIIETTLEEWRKSL